MKGQRLILLIGFIALMLISFIVPLFDKSVVDKMPYTLLSTLSGLVFGYYFDTGGDDT